LIRAIIPFMWLKLKTHLALKLPPLALGLFAGRVLSEWWAIDHEISLLFALFLTILLCILSFWSLHRRPLRQMWPLLLLTGYVFYPDPNPLAAATAVLLVTAVLLQMIHIPSRILKLGLLGSSLLFATLYILTLAPGLLPADSGEFQLVGATLGVAHPPGFPLYTLMSKLMTWLPLPTTAAYKINLLSAISSSATLSILYLTVLRLTRQHLAAITAVISLGTATTFWAQATTANIRSFTALFASLAIYALICHWQEKGQTDRYLLLLAASLSFGFTHHLSLAFMGLIFGITLFLIDPQFFRTPSRWKRPFLAALLGLIPLLYLPLRAGADVPGAREGLNTIAGFLNHFLALGFQGDFFYFIKPVVLWPRLQVMGNLLTFQFSPWLLAAALLGWGWLLRRNWRIGLLLGGSFGLHTLVTATYRAPQTVEYMLPAYLPVAICIGLASGYLADFAAKQRPTVRWLPLTIAAVLFTVSVGQGWQRWPSFAALQQGEDARDYAQTILDGAPPDSLILANWHWVTPLWYLQTVEGSRPDVTIEYVAPGEGAYSQTWVNRIEKGLGNGRSVIATYIDEAAYAPLFPGEPLGEALLFRQTPRTELPANFIPLDITWFDKIEILGYRLDQASVEIGQEATVTVAWQAETQSAQFFIHLLDENQSIVAQDDVYAIPQPEGLTLTQFRLTPRRGPGEFRLRLGSGSDFAEIGTLSVTLSSLPPATQHPVYRPVVGERPSVTLIGYDWDNSLPGQTRLYLHWKNEAGYWSSSYDNPTPADLAALLPAVRDPWGLQMEQTLPTPQSGEHYVPLGQGIVWTGTSLDDLQEPLAAGNEYGLSMRFINGRPLLRDYVVSTRLVGYEADNFTWAWCDLVDGVPAMGGIPTLKWIQGSQVQSPRTIIFPPRTEPANFNGFCQSEKPAPDAPFLYVDNAATAGQTVGGILRLYDAFTNRPLPILDERITAVYSWIPLGETKIGE
jgi:Protein O-mannosyl-transferase TMEM260-like